MALKKEDIKKLADLAKLKVEDLEAALQAEAETAIEVAADLHVYSQAEIDSLKTNEYKRGQTAAVEIAVKDAKEKLGLDFQGKTIDGLADAVSRKALADAKIEPEKKVQELQEKLANVQKNYGELETKLKQKESEVEGIVINSEVFKYIPAFGENAPALGQEEVLQLMRTNGYEFKKENGAIVAYKGGNQVLDKVSKPIELKEVVTGFLKEKKLITEERQPEGRGAGSGQPAGGKFTSLSELKKNFEATGKNVLGKEFADAVQQAVKDNPEFAIDK